MANNSIDNLYPLDFHNNSGEEIPAHACIKVGSTSTDVMIEAEKPDGNGSSGIYYINGPTIVAIGGYGSCTNFGPVVALNNSVAPTTGDAWGPTSGQWYLTAGNVGFKVLGGSSGGRAIFDFFSRGAAFVPHPFDQTISVIDPADVNTNVNAEILLYFSGSKSILYKLEDSVSTPLNTVNFFDLKRIDIGHSATQWMGENPFETSILYVLTVYPLISDFDPLTVTYATRPSREYQWTMSFRSSMKTSDSNNDGKSTFAFNPIPLDQFYVLKVVGGTGKTVYGFELKQEIVMAPGLTNIEHFSQIARILTVPGDLKVNVYSIDSILADQVT